MYLCDHIYLNRILYDGQRSLPIDVKYNYNINHKHIESIAYCDEFNTSDELYDPWWDSITIKYDDANYSSESDSDSDTDYNSS